MFADPHSILLQACEGIADDDSILEIEQQWWPRGFSSSIVSLPLSEPRSRIASSLSDACIAEEVPVDQAAGSEASSSLLRRPGR